MSDFNPYAAPKTEIVDLGLHGEEEGGLWRDGRLLVIRKSLPEVQ